MKPSVLLEPIVLTRARLLSPAVFVALVFFVAASDAFAIRPPDGVMVLEWVACAASGLLAIALVAGRVRQRYAHAASTASLWFPMIAAIVPLYATGNPIFAMFLVVEIACAGVLLHTGWMLGTLGAALACAIPATVAADARYSAVRVATLVTAALFATLTHALMRRALVREAWTARALACKLEEYERLQEEILHAQRMDAIGTLAAGLAHDVNNVLTSITSLVGLVAEDHPAANPDLDQIIAQAERGAALTRGLLAFARRGHVNKQVVCLSDVIRDVLKLLARTLPKTVEIRDQLTLGDCHVEADMAHLGQVFVNLSVNAADAMCGAGTLVIGGEVLGDRARITVSDTGKGMDEETRRRAFEPFFTTKPSGHGTGLGLSTVWGIVRAHGGTIDVASAPGRGTTFTIELPTTSALSLAKPKRPGTGPIVGTPRVLVVDDDQLIRSTTRRLLERLGVTVEVAADGAEAIAAFDARGGDFDAVVLDMGMPVMGGAECFRCLRKRSQVPVLLATGYAIEHELAELVAAGADVIEKPYSPDQLRRHVARLLDSKPRPEPQASAGFVTAPRARKRG